MELILLLHWKGNKVKELRAWASSVWNARDRWWIVELRGDKYIPNNSLEANVGK